MTDTLNHTALKNALEEVGKTIIARKEELCRLDSLIGDGDHGVGMSHGFESALKKLSQEQSEEIDKLMRSFGMGVISGAGGASGPLFGGLFTEGAKAVKGRPSLDAQAIKQWWKSALEATMKRGGAKLGDKTMVDALIPAVEALETSKETDLALLFQAAAKGAWEGVEKTKQYVAGQGRSRYLGERAIGHQDAGATSVAIILDTLAKACA
ncbi:MAG: dihydroxyacetone kinase subunit L [Deltaproteobacteria bacterium]|jgi:dihydroxyacetone kinase phosphoprotein-dependent L subunit|nr:dihydroxyacetone kinase subunit L [Deltaproteobacteria bacterium]